MSEEKLYKIEYEVDKETGQISATLPELNHVSSFGDTYEEATAMVKEAAECYLEGLQILGKRKLAEREAKIEGSYIRIQVPAFIN